MRKVLIVCYYWPPAGGPGVQRWLKFVKYLPEFDIEPIVFVPENPNYPILDKSLEEEISGHIRVIKQRIFEPYGLASFFSRKKTKRISSGIIQKHQKQSLLERGLLWIRGNFFIPDARKYWVKPSVNAISKLVTEEKIQTIITTGPPHSVHLIGLQLKVKFDLQWIADFRDPWTSIGYHKKLKLTKASRQKHKFLEKQVLNSADQVVVTSNTTRTEFEKLTSKPVEVITNGFDGDKISTKLDEKFTISHIGSLLTDRNPTVLWQVLQELCDENSDFKKKLAIQLIGVVGDGVKESLTKHQLANHFTDLGYVSHSEILTFQAKSQVLLLLEIDSEETKGIIPGKLFEYLNARRPILALGPKNWEASSMVDKTKSGSTFTMDDKSDLKNVLLEWFEAFQKGELFSNAIGIEKYSRRELTKKLANAITWESS
ncbi:glycosyltransferase family 4 protein [Croceitalea rosinachiae]|uniref:Glycosyltransferase family 4 protein n=1 Tax=Croceitalea rosinachiae TaxID=3075596 RepID=A0ABU3AB40_9FLAO|nr:glycosyltransferase family 4 protein [Croceitalea sp. F388]MDT0607402.1 glycosyltransferase family 4 protein [Croceitalea sp. F388]